MKLGAEPKKVAILGVLVVVGGYLFYTNVLSQPGPAPREAAKTAGAAGQAPAQAAAAAASAAAVPAAAPKSGPNIQRAGSRAARVGDDFHPTLKPGRPEDRPDPASIDPTLRLDLLAKVQGVEREGGTRNLFQFSTPPPPPLKGPEPKINPKAAVAKPEPLKPAETGPATKPPPPPINLKYYGFAIPKGGTEKTAFFLDGEDIVVAAEGQMVKKRYKVIRVGRSSVVMEDTESKVQQTLPLQEEAAG